LNIDVQKDASYDDLHWWGPQVVDGLDAVGQLVYIHLDDVAYLSLSQIEILECYHGQGHAPVEDHPHQRTLYVHLNAQ